MDKVRGIIGEQLGLDMDKVRAGCSLPRLGKALYPVCFRQVTAASKFVDLGADSLDTGAQPRARAESGAARRDAQAAAARASDQTLGMAKSAHRASQRKRLPLAPLGGIAQPPRRVRRRIGRSSGRVRPRSQACNQSRKPSPRAD